MFFSRSPNNNIPNNLFSCYCLKDNGNNFEIILQLKVDLAIRIILSEALFSFRCYVFIASEP